MWSFSAKKESYRQFQKALWTLNPPVICRQSKNPHRLCYSGRQTEKQQNTVLKLFRIFLPANLYICACALPSHTHHLTPIWQEINVSADILIHRCRVQMCGLNIKWQGQLCIHISPYLQAHPHMYLCGVSCLPTMSSIPDNWSSIEYKMFLCFSLSWYNFILHYILGGQNYGNLCKPWTVSPYNEEQFLYRFYVPLDCFVFECFILSTTFLTIRALTAMQFQQTAKTVF